jgi:hypothetical protein
LVLVAGGTRVSVGVFVTVGVFVRVGVLVGVDVKVGITHPVLVGGRVCVGRASGALLLKGVAVQVAGRERSVGVLVGRSSNAGMVGGGNGFNGELGSIAICTKTTMRTQMETRPTMERISQILDFIPSS